MLFWNIFKTLKEVLEWRLNSKNVDFSFWSNPVCALFIALFLILYNSATVVNVSLFSWESTDLQKQYFLHFFHHALKRVKKYVNIQLKANNFNVGSNHFYIILKNSKLHLLISCFFCKKLHPIMKLSLEKLIPLMFHLWQKPAHQLFL